MADTPTKVKLKGVRFSYAHVHRPRAAEEGAEPKYGVCILISKEDTETIAAVEKAIEAAKTQGLGLWKVKKAPASLKTPLRDGDDEKPDDPNYEGMMFFNANSKSKPGVLMRGESGGAVEISEKNGNEDEFYSGCYGMVTVNFYPYNNKSKGVAAGLGNILKTDDGDRLSGGATAEEDFAEDLGDDLF